MSSSDNVPLCMWTLPAPGELLLSASTVLLSWIFTAILSSRCYRYPHFTEEETETPRSGVPQWGHKVCKRPYNPELPNSAAHVPNLCCAEPIPEGARASHELEQVVWPLLFYPRLCILTFTKKKKKMFLSKNIRAFSLLCLTIVCMLYLALLLENLLRGRGSMQFVLEVIGF